jgi:hypothetical protein
MGTSRSVSVVLPGGTIMYFGWLDLVSIQAKQHREYAMLKRILAICYLYYRVGPSKVTLRWPRIMKEVG